MPVNPPQPSGGSAYDSIEGVLNLVRSLVNDTFAGATNTPGEGRIVVDSAPFIIPLYNSAVRHLGRDLENRGFPSKIAESVLIGIPVIDGPLGPGVSDPTIQVYLGYNGFWDGSTLHDNLALPAGLLAPQRVWERTSAETNLFQEIYEKPAGLNSVAQYGSMGSWDYRGDAIYFNGSTVIMDLRLRYYQVAGTLAANTNPDTFPTTPLPWPDSLQALAYHIAMEFCQSQLPMGQAGDLLRGYREAMLGLAARMVRRSQRVQYQRAPYGDTGDYFGPF